MLLESVSTDYVLYNLMCIAVFTTLIYQSSRQYRINKDERIFLEVMLTGIVMFLSDIIWYIVDGVDGPAFRFINVAASAGYLCSTAALSFTLLVYVDYKFCHRTEREFMVRMIFYALPLDVFILLTVTSQFSHLVYYVDANNVYHRGPLYIVQVLLCAAYVIYATVLAHLTSRFLIKSRTVKKEIYSLTLASLMALSGGIIQSLVNDKPILSMTLTVAVLFIYINVQSKQIYIDTLCGINNRRQFNIYVDNLLSHKNYKKSIYLLMLDIDKFKQINDTYGHIEGDYALIQVAEILAKVCQDNSDFTARYGGDEFAVICMRQCEDEVEKLKIKIKEEVNILNKLNDKPYDISISIGSSKLDPKTDNIESAITKADEQLYSIKSARKEKSE